MLSKQWLLPAYYFGTWPLRRLGSSVACWAGRQPIAILFYHRVADQFPSPWSISNAEFARQIRWLGEHFEFISLSEAQRRMGSCQNDRPAVCITFDDGYAENCEHAIPLLLSRRVPVTYFVASRFVLNGEPFPHDVQRGQPVPPNTVEQLRDMAAAGVEMGAHTRNHRDLGPIVDREVLRYEIEGSKIDLEQRLSSPVRYFAFPYGQIGNLSSAAIQVAREAGLAGICSAYGGYNLPGDDPYHLQRLHADPYFLRLKNWLTLDPRWLVQYRGGHKLA